MSEKENISTIRLNLKDISYSVKFVTLHNGIYIKFETLFLAFLLINQKKRKVKTVDGKVQ